MNYLRFLLLLPILFLLAAMNGCSSDKDPYQGMSEGQIFENGQTELQKQHYDKAVKAFEAQEAKYPYGDYAHVEQLNIIYAYYMNGDYPSAQSAADRFIRLNPTGDYVDYAYYMRAMSGFAKERTFMENYFPVDPALRDVAQLQQSFNDFTYVVQQYPQSPYAQDSRAHLVYIRNLFARDELLTAEYYYKREAYVAAINRAQNVVLHYQGAPSTADALKVMYQSYQKLKLDQDATATLSIIKANYPDLYSKLTK